MFIVSNLHLLTIAAVLGHITHWIQKLHCYIAMMTGITCLKLPKPFTAQKFD